MTASSAVLSLKSIFSNDTVSRVLKTIVEVVAAQAALYTTVIPNPPSVQGTAAITGGTALVSLIWNLLLTWATDTKSAKLDKLASAIDDAVDRRLAAQTQVPQVPASVAPSVVATDPTP